MQAGSSRRDGRATDEEVHSWREEGWVLLEGLIPVEEVDDAAADLATMFPSPAGLHADPDGETERWLGRPAPAGDDFVWPAEGPGFRPEQHRWAATFPFPGRGLLNRLCVHPAVVDFAERSLGTTDIRLYQALASAKYTGIINYEQPMHTDRNHSWLPPHGEEPWWNLQLFVYLSDVEPGCAPTRIVPLSASQGRSPAAWGVMPAQDPAIYAAEQSAPGRRGSVLAYRSNVFHRGADLTEPGGSRFLLGISLRRAGQDWIGYHAPQSRSTSPHWVTFAEGCTPRQLELFGFPPPGHPIWTPEFLDRTAELYPRLDLGPWRNACS